MILQYLIDFFFQFFFFSPFFCFSVVFFTIFLLHFAKKTFLSVLCLKIQFNLLHFFWNLQSIPLIFMCFASLNSHDWSIQESPLSQKLIILLFLLSTGPLSICSKKHSSASIQSGKKITDDFLEHLMFDLSVATYFLSGIYFFPAYITIHLSMSPPVVPS